MKRDPGQPNPSSRKSEVKTTLGKPSESGYVRIYNETHG